MESHGIVDWSEADTASAPYWNSKAAPQVSLPRRGRRHLTPAPKRPRRYE